MFQSDIFNASGILFSAVTLLKQHLRDRKSLKLSAENLDGGMGKKKNVMNELLSGLKQRHTVGSCVNYANITLFILLILEMVSE